MMKQAARIRWNTLFSLLSSGIRLLTNFLLFFSLARFYGPEAFGQFITAHTLSTLLLMLADFGLDLLLTTKVAQQRAQADRLFQSFGSLKMLFSAVAVLLMWLIPLAHDFSGTTRGMIYIFSFSIVFNALANFFFALFKGFEQLQHETWVSLVVNVVLLICLVLLGIFRAPIWWFAAAFTATRALALVLAAIIATRFIGLRTPSINIQEWKEVMRQGWVFGVYLLCGTLFFQLDTLLLALWQGDYVVGIYQSVMKLVALVLVLPDVANSVLLPVLSRFYHENEQRWIQLGRLLNKALWLLGLPIALIFFVFAEEVLHILYGSEKFAPAVPIMRVAAFIILLRYAWEAYGLLLTTSGRQLVKMVIVVAATAITVVLNFYAIPRYGAEGAIWVSLLVNLFVAAGFAWSARPYFKQWTLEARYILPGIFIMMIGIVLWQARTLSRWYILIAAFTLYAFIFYFIGFTKEERRLVFFAGQKPGVPPKPIHFTN